MPANLDAGSPGPAATPFPSLTSPWPVEEYVNHEDRKDVKTIARKIVYPDFSIQSAIGSPQELHRSRFQQNVATR